MIADNYLLIDRYSDEAGFPIYHLFASDDEPDLELKKPLYVAASRDEALKWAHDWTRENVCEYGYSCTAEVWSE